MVLQISEIKKCYKNKIVLNQIDLKAHAGSCVGIVGNNGTGKTTLLSILAGVLKADTGNIYFDGKDVTRVKSFFSDRVAYVPQENPIIDELSVKDNLRLWYRDFNKRKDKQQKQEPYQILGLQPFLSLAAGKLSGGMKKRLSIACALSNHAPILILDEPGAAVDLICKEDIRNYLISYKQQGGIIILTSHEMEELSLCDQMYVLKEGKLDEISVGLSAQTLMAYLI